MNSILWELLIQPDPDLDLSPIIYDLSDFSTDPRPTSTYKNIS
jgi:hypothetical protein